MPHIADISTLLDLIQRSRLMTSETLAAALATIDVDASQGNPSELARRLVAAQYLTRWQADNLLAGRHKGFRLGSYRLLRLLGTGGMSTVYLAEHELMGRLAAIKVLPTNRVADSSYLARFYREARASAALDHPNVVRVYDVSQQENTHYIAMEYVDGQDLHHRVQEQGVLTAADAAHVIMQAALGLQHAHDHQLIHRDIKPANLLLDRAGTVKILDLGLAKVRDETQPSLTLAHDDNVLGTVDFLAPEQALNSHQVDARADIYALGCTLYFLLAGHPPFPQGSLAERLIKHQRELPASLAEKRPDVPDKMVHICQRMMMKHPRQRWQSAGEVADAIAEWLSHQGVADRFARRTPFTNPPAYVERKAIVLEDQLSLAIDEDAEDTRRDFTIRKDASGQKAVESRGIYDGQTGEQWECQMAELAVAIPNLDHLAEDALINGGPVRVERKLLAPPRPAELAAEHHGYWQAVTIAGFALLALVSLIVWRLMA